MAASRWTRLGLRIYCEEAAGYSSKDFTQSKQLEEHPEVSQAGCPNAIRLSCNETSRR